MTKKAETIVVFPTIAEITIIELVRTLVSNLEDHQLLELIKEIDNEKSDWDFTIDIFKYFKSELIERLKESDEPPITDIADAL
jgi:hypothetical protein